jgi:DNA-binding NarL/FixJ family response regulator
VRERRCGYEIGKTQEEHQPMYSIKGGVTSFRDREVSAGLAGGELRARGEEELPQNEDGPRRVDQVSGRMEASGVSPTVIYLDARTLTRDCVGRWLQASLSGFNVCLLESPDRIETVSVDSEQIRAVIINTGADRMSSPMVAGMLSRVGDLLPGIPIAVLSNYEDLENVRDAFEHGVCGYIPTSLTSIVAVGAVHLVCLGGTFAPTTVLLFPAERGHSSVDGPQLEGFTPRQSQILDCLRRGMANKLIAYELAMCESTVKVHIRKIMKKLNATNRTQVAYITRGLFEGLDEYQRA